MRGKLRHLIPVLSYLGAMCWFFAAVVLIPIVVDLCYGGGHAVPFLITAGVFGLAGLAMVRKPNFQPLTTRQAMLACSLGWIIVSAISALPLTLGLGISYLDGVFEAVSGYTTTGITMLTGLNEMPRGVLFWRALMQWLGGLGILSFFMLVVFAGGTPHSLMGAEAHKIGSPQPNPSIWKTLRILWVVYAILTGACIVSLLVCGLSFYDAVYHSFTGLSTGGYSPYDESIGWYRQAGYNYRAIEYVVTFFMLLGGMNFIVHYRVLTGGVRALWDNFEVRLWWLILASCIGLTMASHFLKHGVSGYEETFRNSAFTVVSIGTTTGFGTVDIGGVYFGALAQQVFLILMVVGGCVGSTGGGIKVLRIGILYEALKRQVGRVILRKSATNVVVIDHEIVDSEEIRRVATLFFGWMLLLGIGGMITAAFSHHEALQAFSGSFSALGNIGPCYIATPEMNQLHYAVKITYIIQMLAGRLELLPVLMLLSPRTWR
ncbi:MAG: TrkH family potassium uptake protein [Planctomycetes bacterium]|nr:TrkH family potassium uptake protein [Planctomycetota bacterium]